MSKHKDLSNLHTRLNPESIFVAATSILILGNEQIAPRMSVVDTESHCVSLAG